jgi:hypothetical protein
MPPPLKGEKGSLSKLLKDYNELQDKIGFLQSLFFLERILQDWALHPMSSRRDLLKV